MFAVMPKSLSYKLAQGDAVEYLRGLRSNSVDCIITDPPYESLEKYRKIGTTTRLSHSKGSSNDWFEVFPNDRFPELFAQMFRVMKKKKGSHLYLMSDQETMFIIKPMGEKAKFKFWKPIIWDMMTIGMGYHYRSRYQFILFFEKGKRNLNDWGIPDILSFRRLKGKKFRPAEKPVHLFEVLVKQSTEPGEVVCDPFMGSGAIAVAALKHNRSFIGCDIDEDAVTHCQNRLSSICFSSPVPSEVPIKYRESSDDVAEIY